MARWSGDVESRAHTQAEQRGRVEIESISIDLKISILLSMISRGSVNMSEGSEKVKRLT